MITYRDRLSSPLGKETLSKEVILKCFHSVNHGGKCESLWGKNKFYLKKKRLGEMSHWKSEASPGQDEGNRREGFCLVK